MRRLPVVGNHPSPFDRIEPNGMRILLTGATGFVGGHLLAQLPQGWTAYALARNPEQLPDGAHAIEADLDGTDWVDRLPDRIDAVIHCSQSRDYRDFPAKAPSVFRVNTASTARLLDYAQRSGARHFCLFSTGSVYEPFADQPLLESSAVEPSSINATTKLAAEMLCQSYRTAFSVTVLRVFFPYGPGQTDRIVPMLIDRVRSGQAVDLAGEEGMVFTPTYVADLAKIAVASVENGWHGTFNVAGTELCSVKSATELIASLLGRPAKFNRISSSGPRLSPSLEKLGDVFDLSSMTDLEYGLEQTIKWKK